MKAVVATSRMHEGSRRRTDSCEIPGSGASRQSSMQQDPAPEGTDTTIPDSKEVTPPEQQLSLDDDSALADHTALSSSPSRSTKPPCCDASHPSRPPLRAEGLRQVSVVPKPMLVQPRQPQRSFSVMEPVSKVETTPTLATPPSPNSLSNGFVLAADPSTKTGPHQ